MRSEDEVRVKLVENVFRRAFERRSEGETGRECLSWGVRKTKSGGNVERMSSACRVPIEIRSEPETSEDCPQ